MLFRSHVYKPSRKISGVRRLKSLVDKILNELVVIILSYGRMTVYVAMSFRIEHRHHLFLGEYFGELGVVIFADVKSFTLVFQMFFESFFKFFIRQPVYVCGVLPDPWAFRSAFLQLFKIRFVHQFETPFAAFRYGRQYRLLREHNIR